MQPSFSQSSDDTSNSAPLNPNDLEIIDYDNNNNNELPTPNPPARTQLAQPVSTQTVPNRDDEKRSHEPEASVIIEDQHGNIVDSHGKKRSKDEIDSNDSDGDWDDFDIIPPEDLNKQRKIVYFTRETTARLNRLEDIAKRIYDRGQRSLNGGFIQNLSNLATDVRDRINGIRRGSRLVPKSDDKLIKYIEENYLNKKESDLNNNCDYNIRTPTPPTNINNNNNNNRNLPNSVSVPTSQPSKNSTKKPTIPTKTTKTQKTKNPPPKTTGTSTSDTNSSEEIDNKFGAYQRFSNSNNANPIDPANSNIFSGSNVNQQGGAEGELNGINLASMDDIYKNIDKKEVRDYLARILTANGGNISNNTNGTGGSGDVNPSRSGISISNSNDNAGIIANEPDNS